ncbi:hypothetical protein DFP72DRAFT_1060533 [Ephemerocybe angulata]|uniref:Uncharacterized protein n=1 Tax=Ephemerocybe angulata TaxID=980116 RepID=A0A8H6MCF9_9AGAR|nr:hypothetical protein DFP72DRAFT_1060533 [Tulosesus angulatus]
MSSTPLLLSRSRRQTVVQSDRLRRLTESALSPSNPEPKRYVVYSGYTPPSIPRVYRVPELLETILELSDWSSVMTISRTDRFGRRVAQFVIRNRIRDLVLPYVDHDQDKARAFIEMMDRLGAGITGSLVRRLFALNSDWMDAAIGAGYYRFFTCHDINILVPQGKFDLALEWMGSIGYDTVKESIASDPYSAAVKRFVRLAKSPSPIGDSTFRLASISECRAGIMHAVVASPVTGQANLVTSSRVYSFYPNTLNTPYVLRTDWPRIRLPRRASPPYVAIPSNANWKRCGYICPAAQRNTVGDKGVASFAYDPSRDVPTSRFEGTDYLLAEQVVIWRFSHNFRVRQNTRLALVDTHLTHAAPRP